MTCENIASSPTWYVANLRPKPALPQDLGRRRLRYHVAPTRCCDRSDPSERAPITAWLHDGLVARRRGLGAMPELRGSRRQQRVGAHVCENNSPLFNERG